MFRQYGGLFSNAEKELALKRITNARRQTIVCLPVQSMGKPVVVVPSASKEELSASKEELFASQEESPFSSIASKEESQIASKEESSFYFASQEECQNKGSTPVVVVPMGFGFIPPVVNKIPPVVVPTRMNDGMGHQSSVVVNSPQPRSTYQFADALSNGVNSLRKKSNSPDQCPESIYSNFNSPDQRPESSVYFYQHHQDPPRPKTKFYGQIRSVVHKSITNALLKSETQFNCPITINVHVHQTKFPARRRFTYRRSRPQANITDKDGPELLSSSNVFNVHTDSMSPQKDPTLPLNNNTLPPIDEMILPLCINTLPLPNDKYLPHQQHVSATPTPAPSPSSRYSLLNRADHVPPGEPRSVRGWSGALLNDDPSLPNSKDVRGALCQMRCPEEDKEPIENHSFIVPPCIDSSFNVCTLQECDNKETKAKILFSTLF